MEILFYIHATIAVLAMGMAMFTSHAIHALLYTIFSLLCLAVSMYILSAPLAAALEVIIYAGAIMVLFVFAIMLLQVPTESNKSLNINKSRAAFGLIIFAIFWAELAFVVGNGLLDRSLNAVSIKDIARELFSTYGFLVEVISFVLLAGLATSIFIGRSFLVRRKALEVMSHDSP